MGGCIAPETRNSIDDAIQSSPKGPDRIIIPPPKFDKTLGCPFHDYVLSQEQTGHLNLLVKNSARTTKGKKRRVASIPDTEHPDVINFHRPPKLRPAHDHQCLVAVVTNLSNSSLTPAQSIVVPQEWELTSLSDMTSTKQDFYCLSANAHNNLIIPVRLEIMSEYGRGTVGIVCVAVQIITTVIAAMWPTASPSSPAANMGEGSSGSAVVLADREGGSSGSAIVIR